MKNATPISLLVLVFILASCQTEKTTDSAANEGDISGAYNSLQMLALSRAYPANDIPAQATYVAYEKWNDLAKDEHLDELVPPWENIGPYNTAGRALCVALNPQNSSTVWSGSASGGLWRSYDRGLGLSWERVPLNFPVLGVSSIAFAPGDSTTIYIGTGEVYNIEGAGNGAAFRPTRGTYGLGILKSTDGGITWNKVLDWSYAQERGVWQVRVAPTNANIVYAATTEGTYKSTDAGVSWTLVHDVPMAMDLVIHPTNPDIVFVGCGNLFSDDHGLYRTTDGGNSWTKAQNPFPQNFGGKIMLAIHEADPDLVYASVGNGIGFSDGFTWLCRTTNGGDTWQVVNQEDYSRWQGWFAHDVAIRPDNPQEIITIGISPWRSTNGGFSLVQEATNGVELGQAPIGEPDGPPNYSHSDQHDVLYDPTNNDIVYYATDGGIFISFDSGQTFQSANGGLLTTQFYNGFSVAQDRERFAMGGLQDNATVVYDDDLAWTRVIGGDGSWTAVNPDNFENRFGSSQRLAIRKHAVDNQYFFIAPEEAFDDETAFIAPYVIGQDNTDRMYAGRSRVYRSDDNGENWIPTGFNLNGDPIFAMDLYANDADVLYVATAPINDRPRIFLTSNGGDSFNDITGDLPDRFINDIHVHPENPAIVYVTLGGFGTSHVFRSEDAGNSWQDIGEGLPDVPTSAIIVDVMHNDVLYVGNDLGVYASVDGGEHWESFSQGIVDAALVMDLKISVPDQKLYVATHGSATFTRDLLEGGVTTREATANLIDNVWPNPFQHNLQVQLQEGMVDGPLTARLYNTAGQLVYECIYANIASQRLQLNNLPHLAAGSYTLQLRSRAGTQSTTVMHME